MTITHQDRRTGHRRGHRRLPAGQRHPVTRLVRTRRRHHRGRRDPSTHVVILRAEGRGFNAGVDIKEMQNTEGFTALIDANRGCFAAFRAVYECEVPVVAAVNGFCVGGGIGLVGNADVIVASDDATFGLPEVERGALGAATHLSRLVPQHMMRRLFFTAATVDAATLHHFGSVHEVVPRAELDEAALRVARDIAAKDTRVIRAAKEALNLIDVQRVNSSYRMEQGFTFELNLAGVCRRAPRRVRRHGEGIGQEGMTDKRTTLDEAVSSIESGMTIGIGGWGSRRKPMAFVRALLRTDVKDLTVVTYGGPDLGLLCSAGKVKRVYYGFVSLDSPPFYDPWFAKARTTGAIEAREMDEGMLRCGLQAAAQRLPFLPIRAGWAATCARFWGDELKTVRSPYPTDGGFEELIAMPALNLDAAFVHLNLGDAQGNAAYTGIDPYFDDLFLMAAEQALPVGRAGGADRGTGQGGSAAGAADQPDDGRHRRRGARTAPTSPPPQPDYGRDEKFQRHYAEAAASDESWQQFVQTYLSGSEADYQAAVRKFAAYEERRRGGIVISVTRAEVCAVACAELFRDAGEIMVSPMATMVSIGARLARLTFSPDILLTDGEAPTARRHPRDRRGRGDRGLDAVRPGVRDAGLGSAPCGHGRQPDRPVRQPEPVGVRTAAAPDPADVRRPRRARQHHQPRHQLLGRQPLQAGVRRLRRHRLRNRLGQGRSRQPGVPVRQRLPGGDQPRRVRLQRARPPDAGAVAASRVDAGRGAPRTPRSRCTAWTRPSRHGCRPPTS